MKNNILILLALLLFTACQKQPTANFNTDKTLYYAGETVHLTDASTNAHHWYWTMPDGTTSTNQNVDYVIDTNDIGGDKTFSLTVTSNNGKKLATISKTVHTSMPIYASDFFSTNIASSVPLTKAVIQYSNCFELFASQELQNYNIVGIFLPGNISSITTGVYYLANSSATPLPGFGYVSVGYYKFAIPDAQQYDEYNSIAGQLNVNVTGNKIHVTYSSTKAQHSSDTTNIRVSGDLIFTK